MKSTQESGEFGVDWLDRLHERLKHLREAAEEESIMIQLESFNDLCEFFVHNPNLKYPDVVVTYGGLLRAIWKDDNEDKLDQISLTFLGYATIRYVAFPNNCCSALSGETDMNDILQIIKLSKLQNIVFKSHE